MLLELVVVGLFVFVFARLAALVKLAAMDYAKQRHVFFLQMIHAIASKEML